MSNAKKDIWPIIVIGGGVVGCAVAREFTLLNRPVLLLEKGNDILSGASKANSSILHTGFDAKPNSLELRCMRTGRQEFLRVKDELNLPVLETSALLIARTQEQLHRLPEIYELALENDVSPVTIMSQPDIKKRFPWLVNDILGGIFVKDEHVIDPWSTPLAYAQHAIQNGANIVRSCEVLSGDFRSGVWRINTNKGGFRAELVINASGINGDAIEKIRGTPRFTMKPRKGQFVVFDKLASSTVSTIVLPCPSKISKGVLLAPTIFGNVIVGPTAEEQKSRTDTAVDTATLKSLIDYAHQVVPKLRHCQVTASYAGIRPATEHEDYQINSYPKQQWISVSGIRSTGLTAALGIAKHVTNLYQEQFDSLPKPKKSVSVSVPNLAEHLPRPYQQGANGEIVCHCERVTRNEIQRALQGSFPAKDLDGLKRRTRCLMGRCQGFYCSSRIWQLTHHKITWPSQGYAQ